MNDNFVPSDNPTLAPTVNIVLSDNVVDKLPLSPWSNGLYGGDEITVASELTDPWPTDFDEHVVGANNNNTSHHLVVQFTHRGDGEDDDDDDDSDDEEDEDQFTGAVDEEDDIESNNGSRSHNHNVNSSPYMNVPSPAPLVKVKSLDGGHSILSASSNTSATFTMMSSSSHAASASASRMSLISSETSVSAASISSLGSFNSTSSLATVTQKFFQDRMSIYKSNMKFLGLLILAGSLKNMDPEHHHHHHPGGLAGNSSAAVPPVPHVVITNGTSAASTTGSGARSTSAAEEYGNDRHEKNPLADFFKARVDTFRSNMELLTGLRRLPVIQEEDPQALEALEDGRAD